jgi:hypothetical protein
VNVPAVTAFDAIYGYGVVWKVRGNDVGDEGVDAGTDLGKGFIGGGLWAI